jgi:hypothetical protein
MVKFINKIKKINKKTKLFDNKNLIKENQYQLSLI